MDGYTKHGLCIDIIFGTRGHSYLMYWQLGPWFQIYLELEDGGHVIT